MNSLLDSLCATYNGRKQFLSLGSGFPEILNTTVADMATHVHILSLWLTLEGMSQLALFDHFQSHVFIFLQMFHCSALHNVLC